MSTTEKPYTGLTALVMLNGTTIGYINSVELNLEKDIAEILQFGAQYKEKLPTIKNWTASSDGTVAFASGGAQHKLYQAFETGEPVTLRIKLDSAVYFEGKALIASLSLSGSPEIWRTSEQKVRQAAEVLHLVYPKLLSLLFILLLAVLLTPLVSSDVLKVLLLILKQPRLPVILLRDIN